MIQKSSNQHIFSLWRGDFPFVAVILIVSIFTRFYRIAAANEILFDEVHFGKFTSWSLDHWMYFDIHPPLAKLTFAAISYLMGYDHTRCDYEPAHPKPRTYAPDCEYWKLRYISAGFSVANCVLVYYCTRMFGASRWGGLLAAFFCIFDFLNLIEARAVLINTQLLFWLTLSLYVAQQWWIRLNNSFISGTPMSLLKRIFWATVVGFCSGSAFCVKFTGLGTPGLIGVESATGYFFLKRPAKVFDILVFITAMFLTFAGWYAVHFKNMIYSHALFRQEEEFMTPQFQSLLIGSRTYDPNAEWTEGFWWTFFKFNKRMIDHSNAIPSEHYWNSGPLDWILNRRGIMYHGSFKSNGPLIYYIGNPAVVYGVLIVALLGCFKYFFFQRLKTRLHLSTYVISEYKSWSKILSPVGFCLLGFAVNMLPYAAIKRATFLYHYLPALVYLEILAALLIDRHAGRNGALAFISICIAFYFWYWPWIYFTPLSHQGHRSRVLFKSWE